MYYSEEYRNNHNEDDSKSIFKQSHMNSYSTLYAN